MQHPLLRINKSHSKYKSLLNRKKGVNCENNPKNFGDEIHQEHFVRKIEFYNNVKKLNFDWILIVKNVKLNYPIQKLLIFGIIELWNYWIISIVKKWWISHSKYETSLLVSKKILFIQMKFHVPRTLEWNSFDKCGA